MYSRLPGESLTFNRKGVWTTKKAQIIKMLMDLEKHISSLYNSQNHYQKGCYDGILQWEGTTNKIETK